MSITEVLTQRLSVAVRAVDDFSGENKLVGETLAFIEETGQKAAENTSGYFVFTDVAQSTITIHIENRNYLPGEQMVNLAELEPTQRVTSMVMKPGHLYPFPAVSTLIRGTVQQADGQPVEGAQVTTGSAAATRSGASGTFVLYWGPLHEEDVSRENGRRYLRIDNSTTIALGVAHPSYPSRIVTVGRVTEGELKLLPSAVVLTP